MLMREAAKVYGWNLNYGGIALMWRGGCIIRRLVRLILFEILYLFGNSRRPIFLRSVFLGNIKAAFDKNPKLSNLLLDPFFNDAIKTSQKSWRHVVANAALLGIPTPAFSTALAFYDGYRCARLPANLLQVRIT